MFTYRSHILALVTVAVLVGALWASLAQAPTLIAAKGFDDLPTPNPSPVVSSNTPRPITGVPAATSATGAALSSTDIARFVMSHGVPGDMGRGDHIITKNVELTSRQVSALLNLGTLDIPGDMMLWYVELSGQFSFAGPSQQPAATFTTAFEVFFADSGNIVMEGGLANPTGGATAPPQPTSPPSTVPTATPVPAATATPAPTTPPALTCTAVGRGTAQLDARITFFDVDAGQTSTSAVAATDLQWDNPSSNAPIFAPANGAAFVDFGQVGLGTVSCDHLKHASYIATRFTSAVNDVFGIQTNGGHYALASVQSLASGQLMLQWQAFTIA
jgi:hypothetical protein